MPKGTFCISLDFELHWGVYDKQNINDDAVKQYFLRTREIIPRLAKTLGENGIHSTWATVGALLVADKSELEFSLKEINVTYKNASLDPQAVLPNVQSTEEDSPFHFAKSLAVEIAKAEGQEIASHTFSHFNTLEEGSTTESFERDLTKAVADIRNSYGACDSLVYPRNQYSDQHLSIAAAAGFKVVRTNPDVWFWKTSAQTGEPLLKRMFRLLDHYLPFDKRTSFSFDDLSKQIRKGLVLMPASRFFRPKSGIDKIGNSLKINRILKEMTKAAKMGEIYHLWWHPHNFAVDPNHSFEHLNRIIAHFKSLEKKYGFTSKNMREIADLVHEE